MENFINTNQSVLGSVILDWIMAEPTQKTQQEIEISEKLYHKYVVDLNANSKNKIFPNVYYYVNYNNQFYPNVYMAYIVRDKLKSPRKIPDNLINLNIVNTATSYKGSLICEWAYYQNGSSENPFYIEGCEIVTKYLENKHPLKKDIYYYITSTSRGIRIFRDVEKCPRALKPIVYETKSPESIEVTDSGDSKETNSES